MNRRQEESNRAIVCSDCRSAKEEDKRSAVKKPSENIRDRVEYALRKVCGRVNPDRRVYVIAVLFILFAAVNIWVTFRGIRSIGREGERIEQQTEIPQQDIPPVLPESDEPPGELELEIEEFFNKHFNNQSNDTTTVR